MRQRDVVIAWAKAAPPDEVADLSQYLRNLADEIETTGAAER